MSEIVQSYLEQVAPDETSEEEAQIEVSRSPLVSAISMDTEQIGLSGLSNFDRIQKFGQFDEISAPQGTSERVMGLGYMQRYNTSPATLYLDGLKKARQKITTDTQIAETKKGRMLAEVQSRCDPKIDYILNDLGMTEIFNYAQSIREPDDKLVLIYLDLNRFREINDTAGSHVAADQIIAQFALALVECVRHGDAVSRHGGDEFAMLLNVGNAQTEDLMSKLFYRIAKPKNLTCRGEDNRYRNIEVTSSIGFTFVDPNETYDDAIARADEAADYIKRRSENNRRGVALKNKDGTITTFDPVKDHTERRR